MIPSPLIQSLLDCPALPSIPVVIQRVIVLAADPDSRLQPILDVLHNDPALTARLISLANTVYYAQAKPAETLREAVERLGLDTTVSLALGFSLATASRGDSRANGFDLRHFWQRSLTSAIAAQELATQRRQGNELGPVFTAALLQDIGMLALNAVAPLEYAEVIGTLDDHDAIALREREHFGADHAEVGAWLAGNWGLSLRCREWIRCSHDRPVREDAFLAGDCVMLSGRLADIWLASDGHRTLAQLDPWLSNEKQRSELLSSIQARLPQMAELFEVDAPDTFDSPRLLMEAKQLLLDRTLYLQSQLDHQSRELDTLQAANWQLDRALRYDPLTQLYSRQYLLSLLDTHFEEANQLSQELSVVFLDLDHFKQINDEHGHPMGDEVLKNFASLLVELSDSDVHVGRFGGEEFMVLLPGYDRRKAAGYADRICNTLRSRPLLHHRGITIQITASVGIVSLKEEGYSSPDELIHKADQRMYLSKRTGRNRVTHE
ncbi:GGDEF domain-containing protein [Halomonas sp. HP20-15]|uniref:GGDEF domain-containing protein n=1 Tax=Halomonas sp. HP20-15 TaxID=3085901 RepID=UPI0029826418|nr:GGDEF domain-containing protein [Halomonas sp. HP20-15]MDW5375298.1 GGDEF domain-containing protein [Halomonas sp. HP20-15]